MIFTMKDILLGLVILLPCSLAFPLPFEISAHHNKDTNELTIYLDHYYPCHDKEAHHSLKERLEMMQKFFHLAVTGNMDEETEKVMKLPRCGVPDVLDYKTIPGKPTWDKDTITYRINTYTSDLPVAKVDQIIEKAFQLWADVTPLTFEKVGEKAETADIEIQFASHAHGDFNPFDGPGGVLGHAFPPGGSIGGDAHFDEDEKWSDYDEEINLFLVAAHEFGHSLGLDHSSVLGALMYPTYSYVNPDTFQLSEDDIKGIQSLYGPNKQEHEYDGEEYKDGGEEHKDDGEEHKDNYDYYNYYY